MGPRPAWWRTVLHWVRHPLSMTGAWIAFAYCDRHDLEIRWAPIPEAPERDPRRGRRMPYGVIPGVTNTPQPRPATQPPPPPRKTR